MERRRAFKSQLIVQALVIAALTISGCSTVIGPVDPQVVTKHFAFLYQGQTTCEEVIKRLGNPRNEYKQDATITYLLDGEFEVVSSAIPPIYNLILSFGPDDILTRFSLLRLE